jgi:hypothetical protein
MDSIIKILILKKKKLLDIAPNAQNRDTLAFPELMFVGSAYTIIVIGLMLVGLVRTNGEGWTLNNIIHTGGVGSAAIVIIILTFLTPNQDFHPYYRGFSYFYAVSIIVLGILTFFAPDTSECVGAIVTLTTLEIVTLSLITVWTYLTIINLLNYANEALGNKSTN